MSVMGTGIAAGVAQTAQQAQQVSRRRDKKHTEDTQTAERTREIFERQLRSLEEDDGSESTQVKVQSELHDRDHPLEDVTQRHKPRQTGDTTGQNAPPTHEYDPDVVAEVLEQLSRQAQPELSAEATAQAYRKRIIEKAQQQPDQPLYKHLDLEA